MTTAGTPLAGVCRKYHQYLTAAPELLVLKLTTHFVPALTSIERSRPDLTLKFRPGCSGVPFADFDMLPTFRSSMTIIAWFLLISLVTL
ncbi:hypothetical protein FR830_25440 (plasmid) [Klebsiella aerogenes]|nr:hypothetical protein FR830_25440 [Klebsiella aerogenes]